MRCTRHGRLCGEPPPIVQPPQTDARYRLRHLLGKGGFARVYSVAELPEEDARVDTSAASPAVATARGETGSLRPDANEAPKGGVKGQKCFALKVISKCRLGDTAVGREALRNEVSIHRQLSHPAIVKLVSFWEDQYRIFLLMHMVDGPQLEQYVKARGRLSEAEASLYAANIFEALSYLHANRVVHRDLKLANLLLSHDRARVYLCDFGLATHLDSLREDMSPAVCGTPNYVAPELLTPSVMAKSSGRRIQRESFHHRGGKEKGQPNGVKAVGYTTSADSWSMGIVLYTMLVGTGPFDGEDLNRTFRRIRAARFTFPLGLRLSPNAKSLIRLLLSEDHTRRPSADMALRHPFFTANNVLKLVPRRMSTQQPPKDTAPTTATPDRDSQNGFLGHTQNGSLADRDDRGNAPIVMAKRGRLGGANRRMEPRRWSASCDQQTDRQAHETGMLSSGQDVTRGERPGSLRDDREPRLRNFGNRTLGRVTQERSASLCTSESLKKPRGSSRSTSFNSVGSRGSVDVRGSGVSAPRRRSSLRSSEKRHEVLNLSVTLSAALMRGRKLLDESAKENTRVSRRERFEAVATQLGDSAKAPPLVRRWLDYTSKYGFAAMMDDGRTSCCFNDGSIMFFVSESNEKPDLAYISPRRTGENDGKSDADGNVERQRQSDISKKACLSSLLADMMVDGGRGSMYDLPSACNVSFLKSDADSADPLARSSSVDEHKDVVHVREWARFRNFRAAAFRLSNHSLHVKFDVGEDRCDDFVFNPSDGTLFYRDARTALGWHCAVRDLGELSASSEHLHTQLTLCAQAISKFLE